MATQEHSIQSTGRTVQHGRRASTRGAHVATAGVVVCSIIDVPGAFERGADLNTEIGAWIGLLGGIIWSVGAGLLAKEPEGDDDWNDGRTEAYVAR